MDYKKSWLWCWFRTPWQHYKHHRLCIKWEHWLKNGLNHAIKQLH